MREPARVRAFCTTRVGPHFPRAPALLSGGTEEPRESALSQRYGYIHSAAEPADWWNRGFMIPPSPHTSSLSLTLSTFIPLSPRACVYERQLLRCITRCEPSQKNGIGPQTLCVDVRRWLRPSAPICIHTRGLWGRGRGREREREGGRERGSERERENSQLPTPPPFSSPLSLSPRRSAEGPEPPVAEGGVEPRLHPAGLCRQHRHRAPLRPHGQRTLHHPAGKPPPPPHPQCGNSGFFLQNDLHIFLSGMSGSAAIGSVV